MFEKTRKFTSATLAAVWLTISGHGAMAQEPMNESGRASENLVEEGLDALQDGANTLDEFIAKDQCAPDLTETLVGRDVYEEALSLRFTTRGETVDDPNGEAVEEYMRRFRADRREKIEHFFDCSPRNVTLHDLAKRLQVNPRDTDSFERIFAEIVADRGSELTTLYTSEDRELLAGALLDRLEKQYEEYIEQLGRHYRSGDMRAQVFERLEAEGGRLAMLQAHSDLVDILDLEDTLPPAERKVYGRTVLGIITNEFRQYISEAGHRRNIAGPDVEYEI